MNLKKYFNWNYAVQNIKKSKGTIALFLGIIPIINTLFLFLATTQDAFFPSFIDISLTNMLGIYVIPIVLSICLFSYIYKKKSVDFINSMPISRKTVFITNSIIGIGLLLIMVLITSLSLLTISLIGNLFIPVEMIFDYFLLWSITYIFVFTLTNIAMSISGNAITQIIVTALILLLIPLLHDYNFNQTRSNRTSEIKITCQDKNCIPETFNCYESKECLDNKKQNTYTFTSTQKISHQTKYTIPYYIVKVVDGAGYLQLYDTTRIIKMAVISIVGFFIGLKLFINRKMENNEISFKSLKVHNFVKGLTMIPILMIVYEILSIAPSFVEIIIILVITLIYYLLYDLITRKGIRYLKETLISFLLTIIIIMTALFISNNYNSKDNVINLKNTDIDYIELEDNEINLSRNNLMKIRNSQNINKIIKYSLTHYNNDTSIYSNVIITTKDKKKIKYNMFVPRETYQTIVKDLQNSADYINYKKLNFDKIYAISLFGEYAKIKTTPELKKMIERGVMELPYNASDNDVEYYQWISFYIYEDKKINLYNLPTNITKELTEYMNKVITDRNKQIIKKYKDISYNKIKNNTSINVNAPNSNTNHNNISYIISRYQEEFYNIIISKLNSKFDSTQKYMNIEIYNKGKISNFISNEVSILEDFIKEKEEELTDDPEYKKYMENDYSW